MRYFNIAVSAMLFTNTGGGLTLGAVYCFGNSNQYLEGFIQ